MEPRKCPQCKQHDLVKGEGKLEQCSETHIPTTIWTCECGYKRWEPATETRWVPDDIKGDVQKDVS